MKAIILARVSSKEQQEGYSTQTQVKNLTEYCKRNDLSIIKTFEIAESSTRGERKEFKAMLDFPKGQNEKIALVVDCVDRLQRTYREYHLIDDLLQKEAIEIHFVRDNNVITKESSSTEKFVWNIGIAVSQHYTDVLGEKVRGALKAKREAGEWCGSAPIGYINFRNATGKSTITIDKERVFLINKIFGDYESENYSLREFTKLARVRGLVS